MSTIIYAESAKGKIKKTTFELASYASALSEQIGGGVIAVVFGEANVEELAKYGVNKVVSVTGDAFNQFHAASYAEALAEVARKENVKTVLLPSTTDAQYIAGLLSVSLKAGYISNVVSLPISIDPFQVKRTAFSNKAFSIVELSAEIKVLSIAKNSFGIVEKQTELQQENFQATPKTDGVTVISTENVSGKVTIADAEIVVSGGRGLKGPENWGMIEDLASVLGAATACSKPVSDMGWRPHGEHVGQTGKPVASNLYIAIGISGAIQHIAGVNASKVKVVINTDAEAPFFKVADYGVVGDAFEVVPKLIEKLKEFKAQNN